ncbi:MAG TPA: Ig-like domain-containing protein [Longimicrobiaceae bacterium]
MTHRIRTRALIPFVLALAAGCSDTPTAPAGGVEVASVSVAPDELALEVGETLRATAVVHARDGAPIPDRSPTWTSSDTAVATVADDGRVSARGEGSAFIRASSGGKTGQARVTVLPTPVSFLEITPAGTIDVEYGTDRQLHAITRSSSGAELAGRVVAWTSSDSSVAVVSSTGLVTARQGGVATITARSGAVTSEVLVRVPTLVEWVDLGSSSANLASGETIQLVARARAADQRVLSRPITWASSDPGVATVDASGRLTGVATGMARITATTEGRTGTLLVTVDTLWSERRLMGIGDTGLPAILYTTTRSVDGVARAVRFQVAAGRLRMGSPGSRYELILEGLLEIEGSAAVATTLRSSGEILHHVLTGEMMLYSDGVDRNSGEPTYRGTLRPDGALALIGRPAADVPEATLVFGAL